MVQPDRIKLIIVDDHTLVRQGLRSLLDELSDIQIIAEAQDGKQLIQLLKNGMRPDIILLDLDMPNMNGIEATELICKDFFGTKIIMLTMVNDREQIQKCIAAGAKAYIYKNVNLTELHDAILKVMAGQNYFSNEVTMTLLNQPMATENSKLKILSEREIEILCLVAEGLSSAAIGKKLFISARTVETHRKNLMQKLEVNGVASLIRFAIQNKLI